ncbi:hypothetical protein [Paenibacillus elgii]|uniref:hypothetical protein n=1 Tax=Paenibacillus elgii TaxID=189691 RepID=UPI00204041DA|nr:hypothetical protein [Paenibacillus elgii]MCM3270592.1 hypothetical protein [Paenibacillus elgii]GMX62916.1 hypothetical protein Elgi_27230 [Paenibacillus elgii]
MEDAAKHKILLGEEAKLLLQIQTCQEVIFTLKSIVRQRGKSLHMLTMEDILTLIHQMEMDFRVELLHVNLEQARQDSKYH